MVARMIDRGSWPALLYAALSLTVIRMLRVFLCLIGTRTSAADKLFIGWFGPRGLAKIVFAVLVLDEKLPGNDTIMLAPGWTVLLSVIAHGVTANPVVRWDGEALGRTKHLDGQPCHRLRGSRPSLGAAPSDVDTPRSNFAATSRPCPTCQRRAGPCTSSA